MNKESGDKLLLELLEDTKALLDAARKGDQKKIGEQLAKRQECLDKIVAEKSLTGENSEERKKLIGDILSLDEKACRAIRELAQKSGNAALDQRRKTVGVLKYRSNQYDLSSGHLIDKRD